MDTIEFLHELYKFDDDGWLTLWAKQTKQTVWHHVTDLRAAASAAVAMAGVGYDVYYGVGLASSKKDNGRATADDIVSIPGVWVDIDYAANGAHKQSDLPPNLSSALSLLDEFPLPASIVIHTGYGVHAYWLFREPWTVNDATERQEMARFVADFQGVLRTLAARRGWRLDSTYDLARVLRLPGTKNYKITGEPREVKVLSYTGQRYNQSDIEQFFGANTEMAATTTAASATTAVPGAKWQPPPDVGSAQLIIDNCAFIQYCRDNAKTLPEPFWYAMLSNVCRASDGIETAHELSRSYPGYSPAETDAKIRHALKDAGPHRCEYIRGLGFDGCPSGGCGVAAPCSWALSRLAKARATVRSLPQRCSVDDVLTTEVVGALAIIRQEVPAEYDRLRDELKLRAGINKTTLDRAVKKAAAEAAGMRVINANDDTADAVASIERVFEDVPVSGLVLPPAWTVDERGVRQTIRKKDDIVMLVASPVPVILTARAVNVDTGEEKVRLAYRRDGEWHEIAAKRSVAFSRTGIVTLADHGLLVSSESARHLVRYLDDFEAANLDRLPVRRAVARLGWLDDSHFYPYAGGDYDIDVDNASAAVVRAYHQRGGLDDWRRAVLPVWQQFPIVRLAMSVAFAAPLLRPLGARNFTLHLCCRSRGGKTAAAKLAASVYGNPSGLMATFNATRVGLERMAALYNDLPLIIDERQVVGDNQQFVDALVYMLGSGMGKVRGAKGGGIQDIATWRSPVLTTGEEPLSNETSLAGIKTRLLEIHGEPIPDEALAGKMHDVAADMYGTAGAAYLQHIVGLDCADLRSEFEQLKNVIAEQWPGRAGSHVASLATLALAAMIADKVVFNANDDQAIDDALAMVEMAMQSIATADDVDDASRADNFMSAWVASNRERFDTAIQSTDETPAYGVIENGVAYIVPEFIKKDMERAGVRPARALAALVEAGRIISQIQDGKARHTVQKTWRGTRTRFIAYRIPD